MTNDTWRNDGPDWTQYPEVPVEQVYANMRPAIKSGDIMLCSGKGWFSKMIQRATGSPWSHVAFVIWLEQLDRLMVMESVEGIGVRTVPISSYLHDYNGTGEPYGGGLVLLRHKRFDTLTKTGLMTFARFAVDHLSYPYDNGEIAKIAARITADHFKLTKDERREMESDNEYICSEFAYECYLRAGVAIEHNHLGFISPADFAMDPQMQFVSILKPPE